MMKAERQELILKHIADNGRVVVTDFAKKMGVTEATLRKDLQELDDRGAVQRPCRPVPEGPCAGWPR